MKKPKRTSPELDKRVMRLEDKVSRLYDIVVNIKGTVDEILHVGKEGRLSSSTDEIVKRDGISQLLGIKGQRLPNPWALDAAFSLLESRFGRRMLRDSSEVYRPTIETLRPSGKWLSAQEVGRITRRARNTESAYLNRLWKAGLVDRKKHENKTVYSLADEKTLERVFGAQP